MSYQPRTGARCACRPGIERDNCPQCEGTGLQIDFAAIHAARYAAFRGTLCGTRRSIMRQDGDYRVVCATCGAGGTVPYRTPESASAAAVRDSARPCSACGAS